MTAPGNVPARAEQLAMQGRVADAFALLNEAIAAGDGLAASALADWRMAGAVIRRDLGEARMLYGLALDRGCDAAGHAFVALLANGAGGCGRHWDQAIAVLKMLGERDPAAARQLALLDAMRLNANGDPVDPAASEALHPSARIARLPGFLSADECAYLADIAQPALMPALVVDPRTGEQRPDPVRNAQFAAFPFVREDPVLHAINRRVAKASGTSWEQGEPVQVLSYRPGQEYKLHSDALPPGHNQRDATVLVWLNQGFGGGATHFPRLGLELKGAPGDALLFVNTDALGEADPLMWHAGLPVTSGHKLLLSKWIRAAPLDLSGPPGRSF